MGDALMEFGEALFRLKAGKRVARRDWHGAWLVLVPGSAITVTAGRPLGLAAPELIGAELTYRSHIDIYTGDGMVQPWTPSQRDLLAADWTVL